MEGADKVNKVAFRIYNQKDALKMVSALFNQVCAIFLLFDILEEAPSLHEHIEVRLSAHHFAVLTALKQLPFFEQVDHVRVLNRLHSVSHIDCSHSSQLVIDVLLYTPLCISV